MQSKTIVWNEPSARFGWTELPVVVCIHFQVFRHVTDPCYWYSDLLRVFADWVHGALTWTSKGNSAAGWMPACVWLCLYLSEDKSFCGASCLVDVVAPQLSRKQFRLTLDTRASPPPAFICDWGCVLFKGCSQFYWKERSGFEDLRNHRTSVTCSS